MSNCGRHPVDDSIAVGVVAGNEEDPTSGTPLAILGTTPGMPSQMGEWIHFVVPWDEWRAYDEQNVFVFADLLQRIDSCGPVGGRVGTFRDGPPCD